VQCSGAQRPRGTLISSDPGWHGNAGNLWQRLAMNCLVRRRRIDDYAALKVTHAVTVHGSHMSLPELICMILFLITRL
jgi:hypothetical protein